MTTTAKDNERRSRQRLEMALSDAGAELRGAAAKCPFHEDRSASGSIHQDEAGVWRFRCHAASCGFSGDVFDVRARHTGQTVEDQLREIARREDSPRPNARHAADRPKRVFATLDDIARAASHMGTVEAVHAYANPDTGAVEYAVARVREPGGRKVFHPYHPVPGGFSLGAPPKPWPLYNRTRLRTVDEVIVVEGEKCVEALAAVGVVATTSPAGAGKGEYADWSPLAGKTVHLWPDADPPDPKTGKRTGVEHMDAVAKILESLVPPAVVYRVDCDALGLPPKGDVCDYLDRLPSDDDRAEAVRDVLRQAAHATGPAAELGTLIEETISGERRSLDWPWPNLSKLAKSLFPGTTTLLCGDPGSAKSFMMLEAFWRWHEAGLKVALYELEDPRPEHMLRVLAQMSRTSDVVDDGWARENPSTLRRIFAEHEQRLASFGRVVTSATGDQPTLDDLADWVTARCAEGCQIIGIDPVTYAASSDKPWNDDKRFLWRAKCAIERTGARLILVTHPKKGAGGERGAMSMDDASGGAAYPRHAQSMFWLTRKDEPEDATIHTPVGNMVRPIDRIVRILKGRKGRGTGLSIGYTFDPGSLTFDEEGVIVKPPVKRRTAAAGPSPRVQPMQDPFNVEDLP
jgi:hypothetical protein